MKTLSQGGGGIRHGLMWIWILVLCICGGSARAATHTWTGPAGGSWSVAGNWTGGVPTTGEAGGTKVQFGTNTTSVCNITVTVDELRFTGGGNVINGNNVNVLSISGAVAVNNIISDTGTNLIASTVPLSLTGSVSIFASVPAGTLVLACNISATSSSAGLRIISAGANGVTLNGVNNTYTGVTTVAAGTLMLNSGGTASLNGALFIGVGSGGTGAFVQLLQSNQIADSSSVSVLLDGQLNLGGFSDNIGALNMTGGTVAIGTGVLNPDAVTMAGGLISGAAPGGLSLDGNIIVNATSTSGTAVISAPIILNQTRDITVNAAAGAVPPSLTLSAVISNGASVSGFTKKGTGTMLMTQGNANTYTGGATVAAGVVQLNGASGTVIPGPLAVGDGSGTPALLQLLQLQEISGSAAVTVNLGGTLDLNGFAETFGALSIVDGSVIVGDGHLLMNSINMSGGSITSTGAGKLALGGNITATSTAISGDAAITASIDLGNTRTFTIIPGTAPVDLTINGLVANGSGTGSIIKNGSGTMRLGGSTGNTFTGTVTIDQGTLLLLQDSGRTIPSGAVTIGNDVDPPGSAVLRELINNDIDQTVDITINASGVLDMNGYGDTIGALSGSGTILMPINSGIRVATDNSSTTFSGNVAGVGNFQKNGTGTLALTGTVNANALIVTDGTLQLNTSGGVSVVTRVQVGDSAGVQGTAVLQFLQPAPINGTPQLDLRNDGVLNLNGVNQALGAGSLVGGSVSLGSGRLTFTSLGIANATLQMGVPSVPTQNVYPRITYGTRSGTFTSINGSLAGYNLIYDYTEGGVIQHLAFVKIGVATTLAATNVLNASAKLNGTINPGGKTTSAFFQYGTTKQYGKQTALVKNLNGAADLSQNAAITGLNGGTTYHYQIIASNSDGFISGGDMTFTTLGPIVAATAASNVQGTTANVNGMVNPQGMATGAHFEYGIPPVLGSKTSATLVGNGMASLPATQSLTGLQPGQTYYYRIVASNTAGVSRSDMLSFTTKLVLPPVFLPGGTPVSLMRAVGTAASFTVNAAESSPTPTGVLLSYQWMRNGKAIAGATASTYNTIATLTNAGAYTCVIKNTAGAITSPAAELGVVEASSLRNVNKALGGKGHTFIVQTAGNLLTYAWKQNGLPLPDNTGQTLVLTNLLPKDSGNYTCDVSNPGGSVPFGTIKFSVFSEAPVLITPVNPTQGIVGGSYSFQIPYDQSPERAPTGFIVKNLPAGLKVDTFGLISGRITTANQIGIVNHPLLITASNSFGKTAEFPATLTVHPFPTGGRGVYNGTVDRHVLNNQLGGSLNVTISGLGNFSGKLLHAGTSYPIKGDFDASIGSTTLAAKVIIKRAAPFDLTLNLLASNAGEGIQGTLTNPEATEIAQLDALRNPFTKTIPFARAGTFTSQFIFQNGGLIGNVLFPQGRGYASIVVKPEGTLTCTAKMADSSSPSPATFSTTISSTGEFLCHFMLNANTASVQGSATITPDLGAPVNGGAPLLSGAVDWYKASQLPTSKDRIYRDGITNHVLIWQGGKYTAPASGTPVLGLAQSATPGVNNAKIVFNQGGLTGPEQTQLNRNLRITSANKVDLSNPSANPAALKLTVNAGTGAFSGSFALPGGRAAKYTGLLISRTDIRSGSGHFILPGLAPSVTTSPMLSGEVLLLPP